MFELQYTLGLNVMLTLFACRVHSVDSSHMLPHFIMHFRLFGHNVDGMYFNIL